MRNYAVKKISRLLRKLEKWATRTQGKGLGGDVEREFEQARTFLPRKAETRLFVDVGGNKGNYTAQVLEYFPEAEVVIYEPAQTNVRILGEKFRDYSNVSVVPVALSSSAGTATLFSDTDGSGLGSLVKRSLEHFGKSFDVNEEIQADTFARQWERTLGKPQIALMKIDVEGHELEVLEGMGEALVHCDVVQFEFGGADIDSRLFFRDFWNFFTRHNFRLYRISPLGPLRVGKYREEDEWFAGPTNYLAVNPNSSAPK